MTGRRRRLRPKPRPKDFADELGDFLDGVSKTFDMLEHGDEILEDLIGPEDEEYEEEDEPDYAGGVFDSVTDLITNGTEVNNNEQEKQTEKSKEEKPDPEDE